MSYNVDSVVIACLPLGANSAGGCFTGKRLEGCGAAAAGGGGKGRRCSMVWLNSSFITLENERYKDSATVHYFVSLSVVQKCLQSLKESSLFSSV